MEFKYPIDQLLLDQIDEIITRYKDRKLVPTVEVIDDLLDVRSKISQK